ncbi:MAG: inorganic pyrophosphatase [Bacteroidetes bacterium]|nr:MAG: inorganic pyrophosphatase [Bacteroidota bacterium]
MMARFFYEPTKSKYMFTVDIVIETPKGSALKYDYDPTTHFFKLKKILPSGMVFPYDFGFIPGTKGEDGDPLDIIMISEFASFPGCVITCKIIGGFKAEQSEEKGKKKMIRNDRFFSIPKCSQILKNIKTLGDLPLETVNELEDFFIDYNRIEGKEFHVLEKLDSHEAKKIIVNNNHKNEKKVVGDEESGKLQ